MSYVDTDRSGTTFGVVLFNDIFAPNTTIPWSTIVNDGDTIICKVPFDGPDGNPLNAYHLLTAYKDAAGKHHWYGPGVYLCMNVKNGTTVNAAKMGNAMAISDTAAVSSLNSRPCVNFALTSTDRDFPMGVALEPMADQGLGSVAMAGIWPVMRGGGGTWAIQQHLLIDNSSSYYGTFETSSTDQKGAMGKLLTTSYDIITDASGTTTDGGVALLWGSKHELF